MMKHSMKPRAYLNFMSNEWPLVAALHHANRNGVIDYGSLLQLIRAHKKSQDSVHVLLDRLLELGILGQPLSSETMYQMGSLAETIAGELLHEQRLGLPETTQGYVNELERLSEKLLEASREHDPHGISSGANKIRLLTQDIKHQAHSNLQAIRHIVAEAKQEETRKPLRQRYHDVIEAWTTHIDPLGEMVQIHNAFDQAINNAISQINQAITNLESSGGLISESANLNYARQMIRDTSSQILRSFQLSRDILRPLYETARLNTTLTRGASRTLELIDKGRLGDLDRTARLPLYRRKRYALMATDGRLMEYIAALKQVEHTASPAIALPEPGQLDTADRNPPLDKRKIMAELANDLPISDLLNWIITHHLELPISQVLDIVQQTFYRSDLRLEWGGRQEYRMHSLRITAPVITVEKYHDRLTA